VKNLILTSRLQNQDSSLCSEWHYDTVCKPFGLEASATYLPTDRA